MTTLLQHWACVHSFSRSCSLHQSTGVNGLTKLQWLQAFVGIAFAFVSRAVANADRLPMALHLVHALSAARNATFKNSMDTSKDMQWELLLKGSTPVAIGVEADSAAVHTPAWMPERSRAAFTNLVTALPEVASAFEPAHDAAWATWQQRNDTSAGADLPQGPAQLLSALQQALVVQVLSPERLHAALASYAASELAVQALAPPPLSFEALAAEAGTHMPVLFVTAPGGDPSALLREHAHRRAYSDCVCSISTTSA